MGIGVDPTVETAEYGQDNRQWLGSSHGTQATRSCTILADDFIGADIGGEVLADGDFLPSGVPLGFAAGEDDVATLSLAAAVDGTEDVAGYLYSGVKLRAGRRVGVALFEHGKVRRGNLPAIAAGAGTDSPHIIYLP